MARVETGHIHLGSSILHHTDGWETKSQREGEKKKSKGHTETRGQLQAHLHSRMRTNKQRQESYAALFVSPA